MPASAQVAPRVWEAGRRGGHDEGSTVAPSILEAMEIASLCIALGAVVFAALAWVEGRRNRQEAARSADAAERAAAAEAESVLIERERLERERLDDLAAGEPRLEVQRCLFNEHRREFLVISRNVGAHAGLVSRVRVKSGPTEVESDQPRSPMAILPGERQSMGLQSNDFQPLDEVELTIYFANDPLRIEWRLTAHLVRDGEDHAGWPQWRARDTSIVRLGQRLNRRTTRAAGSS